MLGHGCQRDWQGEITALLERWREGDREALNRLVPFVYQDLKRIAGAYLRRESATTTLQATALVHELYMRLQQQRKVEWKDRSHFFAFAGKVMRMLLADHARAVNAGKRGGDAAVIPLSDELPWIDLNGEETLELNLALEELERVDPEKVSLIELRYFLGCTAEEVAAIQGKSKPTVDRDLRLARSWLFHRLRGLQG